MKTHALTPEASDVGDGRQASALAQGLFLRGSDLPRRWAGRDRFVVMDTNFGLGHNFLAVWQAWQQDPQRCERLFFVSVTPNPPRRADLVRAHAASAWVAAAAAMQAAWPPLTVNLHTVLLEGGRVRLLIGFGDLATLLPELQLRVDAFFLGGIEPRTVWDRRIFKALARCAEPGASVAMVAIDSGDDASRNGLAAAGFEVDMTAHEGDSPGLTRAHYAPRFSPRGRAAATSAQPASGARHAIVIGAGLAGASTAAALAGLGWTVQVLDRHAAPAAETSGNPAGLYHGTVHAGDGAHARLFRAAALAAERVYRPLIEQGAVPGQATGLLRLHSGTLAAMLSLARRLALPADYVQALTAAQAGVLAGVPVHGPAWFYPGGGWLSPPALVRSWLSMPGVDFRGGVEVAGLQRLGGGWRLFDGQGLTVAEAPVVVLANAADAARLLIPLGHAAWPMQRSRGQVSGWTGAIDEGATPLLLPLAGDGYALPLPDGGVLCGATTSVDDDDPALRAIDHGHNFERLARLTGMAPPADPARWLGRVGWRLQADDRLPAVGPVPLPACEIDKGSRQDQARRVPRAAGLWVVNGLGSRGITLAPLMADLLAARITGTPWPLERDLAEAVDPARWLVRSARRAGTEKV